MYRKIILAKPQKIIIAAIGVIYIAAFIAFVFLGFKSIGFLNNIIDPQSMKLHVKSVATTGAECRITENTESMQDYLDMKYPKADNSLIELSGNDPYDIIGGDPAAVGELVVYGTFVGTKEVVPGQYFPLFEVKYYDLFLPDHNTIILLFILILTPPIFLLILILLSIIQIIKKYSHRRVA